MLLPGGPVGPAGAVEQDGVEQGVVEQAVEQDVVEQDVVEQDESRRLWGRLPRPAGETVH